LPLAVFLLPAIDALAEILPGRLKSFVSISTVSIAGLQKGSLEI
jgi:hypothetical protein